MQVSELTPVPTDPVDTRFRRIATPIPVPESLPAIERLRAVEPKSMAGLPPVIWQRARGFQVEDPYGNRWIDLTSGAAAANAGHGHPRIIQRREASSSTQSCCSPTRSLRRSGPA